MKTKLSELIASTDPEQVPSNIFIITHKYGAEQAVIATRKTRSELANILLMFNGIVCDQIDESQELYPGSLVKILKHYNLCNDFGIDLGHIEETVSNVIDMYWVWEKESHRLDQIVLEHKDSFPGLIEVIKETYETQNTNDINDHLISLARHYMNEHVVPTIFEKEKNTFFIYIGYDEEHGYYASLLSNIQLTNSEALELFNSPQTKGETLVKVVINFNKMEYVCTIISQ